MMTDDEEEKLPTSESKEEIEKNRLKPL